MQPVVLWSVQVVAHWLPEEHGKPLQDCVSEDEQLPAPLQTEAVTAPLEQVEAPQVVDGPG